MTPLEKAKEIYEYFNDYPLKYTWKKDCAIYCVDEILKEIQPEDPNDYCSPLIKSRAEYWVSVKKEIIEIDVYE